MQENHNTWERVRLVDLQPIAGDVASVLLCGASACNILLPRAYSNNVNVLLNQVQPDWPLA